MQERAANRRPHHLPGVLLAFAHQHTRMENHEPFEFHRLDVRR